MNYGKERVDQHACRATDRARGATRAGLDAQAKAPLASEDLMGNLQVKTLTLTWGLRFKFSELIKPLKP